MKKKEYEYLEWIKFLKNKVKQVKKDKNNEKLDKNILNKRKELLNIIKSDFPKLKLINLKNKKKEDVRIEFEYDENYNGIAKVKFFKNDNKTSFYFCEILLSEIDNKQKISKSYINSWIKQIIENFNLYFENKYKLTK